MDTLYDAAIAGDADAIAKLEMEADRVDEDGYTILHVESQNGNTERVRFILRQFAHKNLLVKLDNLKGTALHLAAYKGHTEVAEILIEAARHLPVTSFQAFLRQGDYVMDTALHLAVIEGHASIVKLLVEADPSDTHIQNDEGKTPMYIAVEKGYNDIVEIISTTCTAPSLDGPDGSTALRIKNLDQAKNPGRTLYKIMDEDALYAASIARDADAISILEKRADILNRDEETILHVESKNGNTERVRFILRQFAHKNLLAKLTKYKHTALHLAVYEGRTEVAEILIDAARHLPVTSFQAFLRQGDKDMDTALHAAVMEGHASIVKLLVEADPSDTHIQNDKGKTPIYIAAERGYYDIVKVICTTCTALTNLDGPDGSTALHAAIKHPDHDIEVVNLLIGAARHLPPPSDNDNPVSPFQAFLRQCDEELNTALHLAVLNDKVDIVKLLVEADPSDTHIQNKEDKTPIYIAAERGYYDIVKVICTTCTALTNLDGPGGSTTALHAAIKNLDKEYVIRLLNDEYADYLVNFADNLGWTALHHAAYHEFDSIIGNIVEAQKISGHEFVYEDMLSTPFHVAAEKGYTSTVKLLLELWPSSSSAYIAVDKNEQNILHLAALQSKKEMIQCILKKCPEEYKNEFVNGRDSNGNTPLHLLIRRGCFVPELLRYEGLDIRVENKQKWTTHDMLYFEDQIIGDQVQIKIALDGIQIDQTRDIFSSSVVLPSKRERKDVIFYKQAERMKLEKHARMKQKEDTHAIADCFANAIAGDPISKTALEMEADTLNEEGKTILHVESMRGDTERVRFIVREFAKKNLLVKLDNQKQTALHLAAHYEHTQVVEVLIDAARHISSFQDFIRQATGPMGNTALHIAVLNGNVAIVKLLVEADPDDSHVQNNEGKTPIYIASENGYKDIVKEICTTCTAMSLDGPRGRTTALHALIQNIGQVTEGANDVTRMMVNAAKGWSSAEDASLVDFEALFRRTDELGSTVLQLAVERNYVDAVKLILGEDPAYEHGREIKRNGLMRLIFKAIDNDCSDDIIKLLSKAYEAGIKPDHKDVLALILAIQRLDEGSVLRLLRDVKHIVTFKEDNGWTPLHYAVYHEFDSILDAIIKAQKDVGHPFVYEDMESMPFFVAVKYGYTSTLVRLLELWPDSSPESIAANSPYTFVDKNGQNILHFRSRKEMVPGIFKYCPKKFKDQILKQQDIKGDTPLHLLISHGCFIPEIIEHKGLDTMAKNKKDFTPRDMLYVEDDIVADQVHIKISLDDVQTNQSVSKLWGKRTFWGKRTEKKTNIWKCNKTPPSKRKKKDGKFEDGKKKLMDEKHEQKKKELETYKMRTNTQIIVTALITTVTFTVGFTMPGGLHQSGEVDEGLVLFSRKRAFNVFMVSDALALLMSTLSLFFYFLESMNEDPRQVSILNASSTVLNILSIMAMMLTFIAGTYVVLSDSPVLAIAVCIIGSLFFLVIIILWIIKIVYERRVKKNKD